MVTDSQDNGPRRRKTYTKTKTVVTSIGPVDITLREHQALKGKALGRTEQEIAELLGISKRTIDFHLANVRLKCKVRTTIAALVMLGYLRAGKHGS